MAVNLNLPPAEDEEDDPFGGLPHGQDHGCGTLHFQQIHDSMAVDLNLPPAEEDDPFGGLPHGQDHPPLAGGHSMGDAYGAPSFDLSFLTLPYTVDEVDGFNAHCFLLLVRR